MNAMGAATALTMAEGESLGFKNLSDYRSLAGGVNMVLKTITSNEAAAFASDLLGAGSIWSSNVDSASIWIWIGPSNWWIGVDLRLI